MTLSQKAFELAKKELGVKEIPGPKSNKRINEYASKTTLAATSDEVAWCSSFVNWCVQTAGGKGTRSAMARSWLLWGQKIKSPIQGDIVVFERGNDGVSGHVAFVAETPKPGFTMIKVLGGNQGNEVNIQSRPTSKVLGYRRSLA